MPITYFDAWRRIVLLKLTFAFTPSGTALKPLTFAAADRAAKSLPALANSASAAGFWIQPIAFDWSIWSPGVSC
jgi:hypothetical protein